uniref:Uncharacterized protein n=1 Tax=Cacopsylla melanoneura TaxID=428564 RepID=A0A8D8XAA0_9HEMI
MYFKKYYSGSEEVNGIHTTRAVGCFTLYNPFVSLAPEYWVYPLPYSTEHKAEVSAIFYLYIIFKQGENNALATLSRYHTGIYQCCQTWYIFFVYHDAYYYYCEMPAHENPNYTPQCTALDNERPSQGGPDLKTKKYL